MRKSGGICASFAVFHAPQHQPLRGGGGAEQRPVACEVLAKDQTGNTVVSLKKLGRGWVIVVNFDLEQQVGVGLAGTVDGEITNPMWKIYAFAAEKAGIVRRVRRADTGLVVTEHPRPDGSLLVCALNTHAEEKSFALDLSGTVGQVWNGTFADGRLTLRGNDGCIFELK